MKCNQSNKKPRIAFCFSGQARTLDQTYQFFQKNLFDVAKEQGFEYDVFCAVEDDEDADKVILLNPTKVEKMKSSEVEKNFLYNVKNEEDIKYFDCDYVRFLTWAVQQQWYKIERSFILMDKYSSQYNTKYDIVFRLRFDAYFKYPLSFSKIKESLCSYPVIVNRFDYYPNRIWSISDFYFICNQNSAKTLSKSLLTNYQNMIDSIVDIRFLFVEVAASIILLLLKLNDRVKFLSLTNLEYLKKKYIYGTFVPELLLYKTFLSENLKLKITHMNVCLLRKTGECINLPIDGINEEFEIKN